jgi:hypothetical protein
MTSARIPSSRSQADSLVRATLALFLWLSAPLAVAQNQLWIQQLGTGNEDYTAAAAPDGSGGVFVGGGTSGDLGGTNSGSHDAWLARFDGAGNQLWIRQSGTSADELVRAAAPDGSGGVYVSGWTDGSLGGPHAGDYDAWIARYDSAGSQLWIRQLGTKGLDAARTVSSDGSGGMYVGGWTERSLGGPNAGSYDAWLARYDSAGNQVWIRQFGTSSGDQAYSSAPDGSGGIFIGGLTYGSLGGPNTSNGSDAWIARYDRAGNRLWIRQLGASIEEYVAAAAPDGSGGVYITGETHGILGGTTGTSDDAWVARYDGAGSQLWIRQMGGKASVDHALAAAPDGLGGVYIAGTTSGSLGGTNAGGGADSWLAQYDSAGDRLWILQLGTNGADEAWAAAPNGQGDVFVGGMTTGSLGGPNAGLRDAWFARYEEPCGAIATYCTAKANSAGCLPAVAASGTPSASAGSGFTISTKDVLDNKFGLYFYGKSGPSNVPFQGGTLCAQLPLVRTMLQNSGGTAPCGGTFQIDFNAYVASGADPALLSGQQVWLQTWSRDPGFAPPDNTSLSDAISFVLCP